MSAKERTATITTFNILHNPLHLKERYDLMLAEAEQNQVDSLLLQEVADEGLRHLHSVAFTKGWFIEAGTLVKHHVSERRSGNVTLSRQKPQQKFEQNIPSVKEGMAIPALITEHENYFLINVHLPWGSKAEYTRLETVHRLTALAEQLHESHPNKLIIMGGDFNATLESSTLRYLHGLETFDKSSTTWTNIWNVTEPFPTARRDGGWAELTAKGVGIHKPELMPDRTIDHLMSYGWNYGKAGCPLSLQKFGISLLPNGKSLSDHYGLTVRFLL